jgi:hypothetical protein
MEMGSRWVDRAEGPAGWAELSGDCASNSTILGFIVEQLGLIRAWASRYICIENETFFIIIFVKFFKILY